MLSRRNIRIKVMQMLYALSRDKQRRYGDMLLSYRRSIEKSFDLYLFNLLQFIKVAEYSKQDAQRKTAKLLPSEQDKLFTAKLGENELIRTLSENEGFQKLLKSRKLNGRIDKDNSRQIYIEFAKTSEYKEYIRQRNNTIDDHKRLLLSLYKHCCASESFNDIMEDFYGLWDEDKSLIVGAVKKTIKALPAHSEFYEDHRPTEDTTVEFGETLLSQVFNNDDELLELIEPTLKNWDADRVAVIDMILLKMALCELVSFPTIPTKVTLNEFVEISKLYSTDKSKDFINGILDRLMKKLHEDGKINKEGRGLVE